VIEQIGTPHEIYREPASPFVADFIGKVNLIPAEVTRDGDLKAGSLALRYGCGTQRAVPGSRVSAFVRPEDIHISAPGSAADNLLPASVEKLEFLGAFCRVSFKVDGLGEQEIVADLSFHEMHRTSLQQGARFDLAISREHVCVFSAAKERLQ
jgi:iron(III) transport system ATP-binding protein